MTKDQFLAGDIFDTGGFEQFVYESDSKPGLPNRYYVGVIYIQRKYDREYHCNVEKITKNGIYVYSSLLSCCVKRFVRFDKMHLVGPGKNTLRDLRPPGKILG